MKYKDYIEGDSWLSKSEKYLKANDVCELCSKHKSTQAHHTSYVNIGEETDEDIMALCDRCHDGIHSFTPFIRDGIARNKAEYLITNFNKYPVIKTIVMNHISSKYYNGKFILDLSAERSPGTPFFLQNIMEIWYEDGIKDGTDIIEDAYRECYITKVNAAKNKNGIKKAREKHLKEVEAGNIPIFDARYDASKKVDVDNQSNIIRIFCLNELEDRSKLAAAKSHMNMQFCGGKIFFNRIGAKDSGQFYKKMKELKLDRELFIYLGGDIEKLSEKSED